MTRLHEAAITASTALLLILSLGACARSEAQQERDDVDASIALVIGDCPVDIHVSIPKPACSHDQESADGKWTEDDEVVWRSDDEPHFVSVEVRGGLITCPQSGESGAAEDYRLEWNRQAQRCVNALLDELGVDAQPNQGDVNAIFAKLTWDQIQKVGRRADVNQIVDVGFPPRQ